MFRRVFERLEPEALSECLYDWLGCHRKEGSVLYDNTVLYFENFGSEVPCYITKDKDHGRIEKREYRLLRDLSWLPECKEWDVIFCEDRCRARKDLSPLNMNILRKTALALCKNTDMGKRVSTQKKRFRAAMSPEHFLAILLGVF